MENIPVGSGRDEPVVNVSWDDAKAFCEWLRKGGRTYRLPTGSRMERRRRHRRQEPASGATPESLSAKFKDVYPWGRQWPPVKGAGNYADEDCRKQINRKDHGRLCRRICGDIARDELPTERTRNPRPREATCGNGARTGSTPSRSCTSCAGPHGGAAHRAPLLSSFRRLSTADRRWRCDGFRCVLVVEPEKKVDEPKKPRKIAHQGLLISLSSPGERPKRTDRPAVLTQPGCRVSGQPDATVDDGCRMCHLPHDPPLLLVSAGAEGCLGLGDGCIAGVYRVSRGQLEVRQAALGRGGDCHGDVPGRPRLQHRRQAAAADPHGTRKDVELATSGRRLELAQIQHATVRTR